MPSAKYEYFRIEIERKEIKLGYQTFIYLICEVFY